MTVVTRTCPARSQNTNIFSITGKKKIPESMKTYTVTDIDIIIHIKTTLISQQDK